MKCIVTGVAGFIGSHIAERLIKLGHTVIGIDDLSAGHEINIPNDVRFERRDITQCREYSALFEGADVIFHQAASKKNICLNDPVRDLEVNGLGTLKLLQVAVEKKIKKFVHASTGSVYGEVQGSITEMTKCVPVSYYGVSKLAGESYVRLFSDHLDTTILRYFHVYGTRQESHPDKGGVVAIFRRQINEKKPIVIHGDGMQKRVFTHVSDIVEANIRAWLNPTASGKIYNCASSRQVSIIDLALLLMNRYGTTNIVYKEPLPGDIRNFYVLSDRIKSDLNIEFMPFNI